MFYPLFGAAVCTTEKLRATTVQVNSAGGRRPAIGAAANEDLRWVGVKTYLYVMNKFFGMARSKGKNPSKESRS